MEKTFVREVDQIVHVVAGGILIETTEEHPFFVEGEGFVRAGSLKTGDVLRLASGENAKVEKLWVEALDRKVPVYNFEVADYHTYYVSELGVLVHNMCAVIQGNRAWIKHDTYNKIRNKLGDKATQKFVDAMKKGVVSAKGENGIKLLSGKGVCFGGKWYKYEIKVLSKQYGDYRVFGNMDDKSGTIIFELFERGKH